MFCNVHKNIGSKVQAIYTRLPYHFVWAADINKGLNDLWNNTTFRDLVYVFVDDKAVGVKAAWQFGMPALS